MDYFIADLHLEDQSIIDYYHRPFDSVEEEKDIIVNNIKSLSLSIYDKLWILGDIGDPKYMKEIKDAIFLGSCTVIKGNHDRNIRKELESLDIEYIRYPVMYKGLWLSHEPITYIPKECPYLNIHGHIHNYHYGLGGKWIDGNRHFNVSCEAIDYKPISLNDIAKLIEYNM